MKIIFTLFILHFSVTLFSQDKDCLKDFKSGEFVGYSENKLIDGYKIVRKKNKQIETINNGESQIISKINWVNDSTYTLTTLKHINMPNGCDKVGSVGFFKITKCENSYYYFDWNQDGCGEGSAVLKKIK